MMRANSRTLNVTMVRHRRHKERSPFTGGSAGLLPRRATAWQRPAPAVLAGARPYVTTLKYTRDDVIEKLDEVLAHPETGLWRSSPMPAVGVNYGVEQGDFAGWRALHFAGATSCAKVTGQQAAIKLLDAKADATLADKGGGTALHAAATCGNLPVLEVLLERGAPVEARDLWGQTALIAGARTRQAKVVMTLSCWVLPDDTNDEIEAAEANRNVFDPTKGQDLHLQVARGAVSKVKEMVKVGDGNGR